MDTYKLPSIDVLPWITALVFTTNEVPLKDAVWEPLAINGATTDGTFTKPLPSPTKLPKNEPLNEPERSAIPLNEDVISFNTIFCANPLLPSLSVIKIAGLDSKDAENEGTPKFGSTWDKSTNSYLSDVTFLGPFNRTLPLNRLLIAISTF